MNTDSCNTRGPTSQACRMSKQLSAPTQNKSTSYPKSITRSINKLVGYFNSTYPGYQLILVGSKETMEQDLQECHGITIENDHFIKLHTLTNLPSSIFNAIQYVNKYTVNPKYEFNQPGNGGVCYNTGNPLNLGVHRLGLLPLRTTNDRTVKSELNDYGFGGTKWNNLEVFHHHYSVGSPGDPQ